MIELEYPSAILLLAIAFMLGALACSLVFGGKANAYREAGVGLWKAYADMLDLREVRARNLSSKVLEYASFMVHVRTNELRRLPITQDEEEARENLKKAEKTLNEIIDHSLEILTLRRSR